MNRYLLMATVALISCCCACKKETAKETIPTTDSTDYRETYTGTFRINVTEHYSWYTGGGPIQTSDTAYRDTVTISYRLADSASLLPAFEGTIPTLRIAYKHGSGRTWGIWPGGNLWYNGGAGYSYGSSGGFVGADSINFTYGLSRATSISHIEVYGHRL